MIRVKPRNIKINTTASPCDTMRPMYMSDRNDRQMHKKSFASYDSASSLDSVANVSV